MKRDPSLVPLSQQHHNGLALCVLTDRILAEDTSDDAVRGQAKRIISRFEIELVNHFALEEDHLFPACPPALDPLVRDLIADHRQMETMVDELRKDPTLNLVREFIGLLRAHIRREENELFEQAQQQVPRETLDELGREIDRKAVRVCL